MNMLKRILVVAIPVVMLIGCGTTGTKVKGPQEGGARPEAVPQEETGTQVETQGIETREPEFREQPPGGEAGAAPAKPAFTGNPLDDPTSILAKRVIYFDFDKSDVRDEFRAIIEAHAGYLEDHPSASVLLEGHADERGSREYNVALGERRAKAVRELLLLQGASAGQIETISYGEERPVAFGHDESSWRLNRRVEIDYQSR